MCTFACIQTELITDREYIKKISLDHYAKVLSKNKIRGKDKEELKKKEVNIDKLNRGFKEITNGVHNAKHKSKPHTRDKGKKHKEKDN